MYLELWILLILYLTKYPHIMDGFVFAPIFQGQIHIIVYLAMSDGEKSPAMLLTSDPPDLK